MPDKQIPQRLIELENKAKNEWIQNSDWNGIILMLSPDEQKEYWQYIKKHLVNKNGRDNKDRKMECSKKII